MHGNERVIALPWHKLARYGDRGVFVADEAMHAFGALQWPYVGWLLPALVA